MSHLSKDPFHNMNKQRNSQLQIGSFPFLQVCRLQRVYRETGMNLNMKILGFLFLPVLFFSAVLCHWCSFSEFTCKTSSFPLSDRISQIVCGSSQTARLGRGLCSSPPFEKIYESSSVFRGQWKNYLHTPNQGLHTVYLGLITKLEYRSSAIDLTMLHKICSHISDRFYSVLTLFSLQVLKHTVAFRHLESKCESISYLDL